MQASMAVKVEKVVFHYQAVVCLHPYLDSKVPWYQTMISLLQTLAAVQLQPH